MLHVMYVVLMQFDIMYVVVMSPLTQSGFVSIPTVYIVFLYNLLHLKHFINYAKWALCIVRVLCVYILYAYVYI